MRSFASLITVLFSLAACNNKKINDSGIRKIVYPDQCVIVLGIAQDAGYPQAGCHEECCTGYKFDGKKNVVCLGLVDSRRQQYWMIEATPDFTKQLNDLQWGGLFDNQNVPNGIFLTHAHIG
ncbi:MAG TPA: hypothetical protein VKH37_02720, partial [Ferruginibacter sp.]|nr:hypothetical protein [Ferruginibacter sp.]